MPPILEIQNISKEYEIGGKAAGYLSLRDSLSSLFKGDWGGRKETFWALDDISFDVAPGESLGIIGRNGAGKSTLLKVLSKITPPTKGRIVARGRVASLLEVGTGFHPELTGNENIYLNGSILGLSRVEIKQKFDEIVDFSGVEKFLETPLKRYSSGMQLRLAFAVAAHLEPEILVIDEVLAVGDTAFQKKCIGKMEEVSQSGRTIIFVSHNMQAVSTLTKRSILLNEGKLLNDSDTASVISDYHKVQELAGTYINENISEDKPTITKVSCQTTFSSNVQAHGEAMGIEVEIFTPERTKEPAISLQIRNSLQQPILQILNLSKEKPFCQKKGYYRLRVNIPKTRLYPDLYSIDIHFADGASNTKFEALRGICPFEVQVRGQVRDYYWEKGAAAYVEDSAWEVEFIN